MKNNRFICTIFLITLGIYNICAQQLSIGFSCGISHAQMSGLKTINNNILKSLPFNAKQIENFPAAKEFNIEVNTSFVKKYSIGFCYNFFSTGSRISSQDYSGRYRFDNISTNHSFGLINKLSVFEAKKIIIQITAALGCYSSRYTLKENLNIYGVESNSDTYKFKSYGMFLKPGVNILYSLERINIGLYVNYYINTDNEIYMKGERDIKLTNETNGDKIKSDWKGFKYGVIFLIDVL